MSSGAPDRIAVVDVGTNSIHLLIARVIPETGGFEVLDRDKEMVRLGAGIGPLGELTDQAIAGGPATVRKYQARAHAAGVLLRVGARSAVGEATKGEVFVARVRKELGLAIEVASGFEEARLTYLAVRKAVDPGSRTILMVDIGGGSTEFAVGTGDELLFDDSIKLGAVRLMQEFFPDGKTDARAVAECRKHCSLSLSPIRRGLMGCTYDWAVGSSGTIQCLGRMILAERGLPPTGRLNRVSFSRPELGTAIERMLAAKTTAGRAKLKGVDEGRADVLPGGALLLEAAFHELELQTLTISEYSIREGVLFDSIARLYQRDQFLSHEGQRYRSVMHLAHRYHFEPTHSEHVTRLALSIYDQTPELHGLGDIERELLEAAALLHDIGLYVSHASHHKHSYYLIRNSQLLGFADYEQQIIALVGRYHRKSPPRKNHLEFMSLPQPQQVIVAKLAGILRIADGLDRAHASSVAAVHVNTQVRDVTMRLTATPSHKLDYAIWGAERKSDLFEEVFNRKLQIVADGTS